MTERIKIHGRLKDLSAFVGRVQERRTRLREAPKGAGLDLPVNALAQALHPGKLALRVNKVRKETEQIKTFQLVADPDAGTETLPIFRAGQYLSVSVDVNGTRVTRPYSISSSPLDALQRGFMELTVRQVEGGFVTGHIWKQWKKGAAVETSGPSGLFYYEPLRDEREIIGLAGGCGFTPFRSMVRDFVETNADVRVTLLFGIRTPGEVIFKKELAQLEKESGGRLQVVYVCSEPDASWDGPSGFLTRGLIKKYASGVKRSSFFICGPPAMYRFLEEELEPFNIPRRQFRWEVFGECEDVTRYEDFPESEADGTFQITVYSRKGKTVIPASSTETVLVAMERAGLAPPARCRSGECGFCNSLLISGEVFVRPENDGRREAMKSYGYIHPCASYPLSHLELRLPPEAP